MITLSPNGPFLLFSKVAIKKTKSATIAFFSFPPFLLLALSFSPLLFLRYYDFGASQSGLRNLPFDAFSLKWLQISLGCFSKNRQYIDRFRDRLFSYFTLNIYIVVVLLIYLVFFTHVLTKFNFVTDSRDARKTCYYWHFIDEIMAIWWWWR